jgi:alpha-glucosidase
VDESFEAFGAVGAPSTWVLSNHDVVRHASRMGGLTGRPTASDGVGPGDRQPDAELGLRRARAASLFTLALPGSMYLYQGEELGLPEHTTLEPEFRQDPTFSRTGGARLGRDGCRVPLPWVAGAGANNGFNTTGRSWLPQPAAFAELARDRQLGAAGSTLELYRAGLALRKTHDLGAGDFDWLPNLCGETSLAFVNRAVAIVHNFGAEPLPLPADLGTPLIESELGAVANHTLAPNTTAWFSN